MNIEVLKTVKMFVGGEFIRSESGRTYSFCPFNNIEYARVCGATRKDFRNAVDKAKGGFKNWSSRTAYNRSQILYRVAEMTQGRYLDLVDNFVEVLGMPEEAAKEEIQKAIDTMVWYAGLCDKYTQVLGAVNPVNSNYHNFSTPEPMGIIAYIENENFSFVRLIDHIFSLLCTGNSVIALLNKENPIMTTILGEIFATSDVPAGTINLLSGDLEELAETIGSHMEVQGIYFQSERKDLLAKIKLLGVENMKRINNITSKTTQDINRVINFVEVKTVWHPIGI
ncbi:aldehyde dehydrogenase family protein [Bacteriovoracaceae bacterium]|nr:aldehyde dehydrogenase family protein [Bacteriovoracaceae bacterium]